MNELLFGRWAKMDEAGDAGGEGGGGGAGGAGGGAGGDAGNLSAAGTAGAGGASGGTGGAGDGGDGDGDAGGQGALAGAGGDGGTGDGEIDWDKVTDAEYFGKVKMPEIDGVQINSEFAAKRYGEFCRKHHISPEVVSEFMKLEGEGYAEGMKKMRAASEAKAAEAKASFDAQGKELHAKYTPVQIGEAVKTIANSVELNGDKDFMRVVTGELSNNKTMVALLLNWAETHKGDGNTGAGKGAGGDAAKGFAARWTGQNI